MIADLWASSLACPALFGKLPGHGDFISRGFDSGRSENIDRWLSNWLALGRADAQQAFDGLYLEAAPWLWAGSGTSAVLMPSADAVGRRYPLLALCLVGTRLQHIYDVLVEAVAAAWTCDTLHEALAEIEQRPVPDDVRDQERGWFLPEGAERYLPSPSAAAGWDEVSRCFL